MKEIRIINNGDRTVGLSFEYEKAVIDVIRTIPGRRWEAERKLWIIPYDQNLLIRLKNSLKGYSIIEVFGASDPKEFSLLLKELQSRKYSKKTIKIYYYYNRQFYYFCKKHFAMVSQDDVIEYLAHLSSTHKANESSINIAVSAFKFFYNTVLGLPILITKKRPKKDRRLPIILGKEETLRILNALPNFKHRAILYVAYSGGMRVSEIAKLRLEDIDRDRGLVFIRRAKGRKDRFTLLADKAFEILRMYIDIYKPKGWLFEGQSNGKPLSIRSMEKIFKKACLKAGIVKNVSIHSLRHCFATHLLECGTDIRYIQELLGHKNLKTTEIYTHVAKKNILSIRSPLDTIDNPPVKG